MSRIDREIRAGSEAKIDLEELLGAFEVASANGANRNDAMAQFLSGGDGWRDARAALRGTFAGGGPTPSGLTNDKDR